MAEIVAGGAEWTKELRDAKFGKLATMVDHPKVETLRILKTLGLQRYRAILPRADEFLANPEYFFGLLGSNTDKYFVAIEDRQTGRRTRTWNVNPEQAITFAGNALADENPGSYNVLVREYRHPNTHVGQVVVGRDFDLAASLRAKDPNGNEVGPWLNMHRTLGDRAHSRTYEFDGNAREILDEAIVRVSLHLSGLGEFVVTNNGVAFTDFFPGNFEKYHFTNQV